MEIVRAVAVPKEGNTALQYEDAWSAGDDRVAVSDGASAAIYARDWAQVLADDFASGGPVPEDDAAFWERVSGLADGWTARHADSGGSWYAQEKLPQGSAASLLVVGFGDGVWRAWAVGDACCFVVADDRLRYAFPLTRARAFGDRPPLVTTRPPQRRPAVVRTAEPLPQGDGVRVLLATDALARWFLSEFERGRRPWRSLPDADGAGAWVAERRAEGTLHDDDVTLVEVAP